MNKKMLFTITAVSMLSISLLTTKMVLAKNTNNNQNSMVSLVQKIADKFGLKKEDVQAIFNQDRLERQEEMEKNREQRQTKMESKFEEQLSKDVKDGKITESQKTLILTKRKELKSARQQEMQKMQGMTEEERKAAMEAKRTKMETQRKVLEDWAKQNNIDTKYLMGNLGTRGRFYGN